MKERDVALSAFVQADGKVKNRPALVCESCRLLETLLVCGISRQIQQQAANFDEVIDSADADYRTSGLLSSSLIRLGFLAALPKTEIVGVIGSISRERHQRLLTRLANFLVGKPT
jgi:mRNA interferase MazF